mmetsp:Transcript_24052/g.37094  ORF Transcript_24052/g.37094 Transcript_24052/m.37094 type:complete len:87 (-) Transcript_24052:313-573(-)
MSHKILKSVNHNGIGVRQINMDVEESTEKSKSNLTLKELHMQVLEMQRDVADLKDRVTRLEDDNKDISGKVEQQRVAYRLGNDKVQ